MQNEALAFIMSDAYECASCQDTCGIWSGYDDVAYNKCIQAECLDCVGLDANPITAGLNAELCRMCGKFCESAFYPDLLAT